MKLELENCTTSIKGVNSSKPSKALIEVGEINLIQEYGGRTAIEMKNGTVIITSTKYSDVIRLVEDAEKVFQGFDLSIPTTPVINDIEPYSIKDANTVRCEND